MWCKHCNVIIALSILSTVSTLSTLSKVPILSTLSKVPILSTLSKVPILSTVSTKSHCQHCQHCWCFYARAGGGLVDFMIFGAGLLRGELKVLKSWGCRWQRHWQCPERQAGPFGKLESRPGKLFCKWVTCFVAPQPCLNFYHPHLLGKVTAPWPSWGWWYDCGHPVIMRIWLCWKVMLYNNSGNWLVFKKTCLLQHRCSSCCCACYFKQNVTYDYNWCHGDHDIW